MPAPRTSGLAIASLICGIVAVFTCCAMVPGVVGVVLGALAIPPIRRGEVRGQALAVTGIVLSVVGLIAGGVVWYMVAASPPLAAVSGDEVSPEDREMLESLGVLEPGEEIELFYSAGMYSVRETGVVITATRLVVYGENTPTESTELENVAAIEFTPGQTVFDVGTFTVETESEDLIFFNVSPGENSDQRFFRVLKRKVADAREAAGKPPATVESGESYSED
jgi:hypothetical protein